MRPIKSGPLTNLEIEELDAFLLSDDGLENAMDVSSLDGFLCAVLSGPNVIMPSKWIPWVWDSTEGNQSPEFTSEKQAQRILDLLMRHANDIAVTLTQFPQYYEPLFLERDHKGRTVSIVDEWCCGYVKGIALDPSGWKPFIEEHPDWFEVIHLYGTESGWDRLKELVESYQDADARHQAFVELIAPAARNIHAYWLARRAPARDTNDDTRRPIHKVLVPGRNDPCLWCSGKEVKHCHGALKLLHCPAVPRIACDPRRPYSSVHGKLVVQHRSKTKNVGTLPPLSSLNFLSIGELSGLKNAPCTPGNALGLIDSGPTTQQPSFKDVSVPSRTRTDLV